MSTRSARPPRNDARTAQQPDVFQGVVVHRTMSISETDERRPRPIGADEESDSESDNDNSVNRQEGAGAGAGAGQTKVTEAPGEVSQKPVSKKTLAFSENDLVKKKGLSKIYEEFPQKCQYKGKGREAEFLRGLMVAYKEWGYQLFPSLAFEDLASRTEKLGGRERTRTLLQELRDMERDRVVEAEFGRSAVDSIRAKKAAAVKKSEDGDSHKTQKQSDTENEQVQPTQTRYVNADGQGNGAAASSPTASAVGGLSAEVRERMEANRRLALERLRQRKEEAAALAAGTETVPEKRTFAASSSAPSSSQEVTEQDLMDVDPNQGAGDDFEDDEAALAEMEAGEPATKKTKPSVETITPTATLAESSSPSLPTQTLIDETAAPVALEVAAGDSASASSPPVDTLVEAGETEELRMHEDGDGTHDMPQASTTDTVTPDNGASEKLIKSGVSATGKADVYADGTATEQENARTSEGALRKAASPVKSASAASDEDDAHLASVPPTRMTAKGGTEDPNGCKETRAVGIATEHSGDGSNGVLENRGAGVTSGEFVAEHTSPVRHSHKGKAAPGGAPMSPLGRMLAETDTPAEGASLASRSPIAGLFANEP